MNNIVDLSTSVLTWLPLLSCLIKSVRCFGSGIWNREKLHPLD